MELDAARALLKAVPLARDIDGKTFYMPIEGQHVFISSRTGGGKNSWTWSLVLLLALAWKLGLVKFWGIDPKRIELAIGRGFWDYYADTDVGMVELLELCVADMQQRMTAMQGVCRRFTPSPATPLNVIIIDEMAYLSFYMADKKLRERADKAVRTILTQGRAPGYAVVGAVQDPRIETCGYRNMFPLRIAGGLNEARQVDMVLGEGMHEAGAYCELIPFTEPGVAYVLDVEHMMKPLLVRAPWCDDEVIQRVLLQTGQRMVSTGNQVKDENLSGQLGWTDQALQQWNIGLE
jgi:S-DNA-T family DNA segregation ATPase FtsK/SpoIIIE